MDAVNLSNKLQREYQSIFKTINRLDRISMKDNVYMAGRDFDVVYEGVFLRSITLFEGFLEDLFIGLLYDKHQLPCSHKVQKIVFPTKKMALEYLNNGKPFLKLLPINILEKQSKVFFKTRNPFLTLNNGEKRILSEIFIIRNSIAHNSVTANKKFKDFINTTHSTMPQYLRTPSKFLQSLNSTTQTKFEIYIIELNGIANKLSTYTG
jgi:hypothetical protein